MYIFRQYYSRLAGNKRTEVHTMDTSIPIVLLSILNAGTYWYSRLLYQRWQWTDAFIFSFLAGFCFLGVVQLVISQEIYLFPTLMGGGIHAFLRHAVFKRFHLVTLTPQGMLKAGLKVASETKLLLHRASSSWVPAFVILGGAFYLDFLLVSVMANILWLSWFLVGFCLTVFGLTLRRFAARLAKTNVFEEIRENTKLVQPLPLWLLVTCVMLGARSMEVILQPQILTRLAGFSVWIGTGISLVQFALLLHTP